MCPTQKRTFEEETAERSSPSEAELHSASASQKPAAEPVATTVPDPEVRRRARRRSFAESYKLRILQEADGCREAGEIGALLRREGLYSSHLSKWREQREQGMLAGLRAKKRGPKPKPSDPLAEENARLKREHQRLELKLRQAEKIIEVQKKVSEILGISLETPESDERTS